MLYPARLCAKLAADAGAADAKEACDEVAALGEAALAPDPARTDWALREVPRWARRLAEVFATTYPEQFPDARSERVVVEMLAARGDLSGCREALRVVAACAHTRATLVCGEARCAAVLLAEDAAVRPVVGQLLECG